MKLVRSSSKSVLFVRREDAFHMFKQQNNQKRCGTCEQLYAASMASCPHCREDDNVPLSDVAANTVLEEEDWVVFEGQIAALKKKEIIGETRKDLIRALFTRAMEVRYKQPHRSRDLFAQVVALDYDNYEARIKISWLDIRLRRMEQIFAMLEPVITSEKSTPEQKKRAYNNICCSFLFCKPVELNSAYIYAKKGLEVDDFGSDKLWENYASILIHQCKFAEARDALKRALVLEPNSLFALHKLEEVNKIIKQQEKHTKKMERKVMKENQENSFELLPWVKNTKPGLFGKRASLSKTVLSNVQFC